MSKDGMASGIGLVLRAPLLVVEICRYAAPRI